MKRLVILGSTGTIGINALKIAANYSEKFDVVGLAAGSNVELLAAQIKQFQPKVVSVRGETEVNHLRTLLADHQQTQILSGEEGAIQVATTADAELVVSAIVGFAALAPTLAAIEAGKDIALANKEAIVAAGPIMVNAATKQGVKILPVDSEHNAIFQALHGNIEAETKKLKRIILTASGGPFLHLPKEKLADVGLEDALKHPTWKMGPKITIDSSTMMNKGLEVIEATRLFGVSTDQIAVQVHPESIIHSMIEYQDGSMLAQLGETDMRGPLAYAMAYPHRLNEVLPSLNLTEVGKLTFFDADFDKFPCLELAYQAAQEGKSLPVILNAANEVCVDAFLNKRIGYLDIARFIRRVVERHQPEELTSLADVFATDAQAREATKEIIRKQNHKGVA